MRQKLPDRRPCETYTAIFQGVKCAVSYGYTDAASYLAGEKPKEVFIDAGKSETDIYSVMRDAATVTSVALQHGISPAELAHSSIRNPDGSPASIIGDVLDDMVKG